MYFIPDSSDNAVVDVEQASVNTVNKGILNNDRKVYETLENEDENENHVLEEPVDDPVVNNEHVDQIMGPPSFERLINGLAISFTSLLT